jgi:hypothetical protein
MITAVAPTDLLDACRRAVGLAAISSREIDDTFLAGLIRRSAGINCPCSRASLRNSLTDSLEGLALEADLQERIESAIQGLIVSGDLLELHDVVIDDTSVRSTWLFAAPPGFVLRPNGAAFLFGVVPDQDSFLPDSLGSRVVCQNYTRVIFPIADEDLAAVLRENGLQHLSEGAWLKAPKPQSAGELLNRFERMLSRQPASGTVNDAEILDPHQPVTFYRGRWTRPKKQTGLFVGRRPQEFGSPLWCAMNLENGTITKLIDLPLPKDRWRGCDAAWQLQMAIDASRGVPQQYRKEENNETVRLDFFGPIPEWAERRLMIFGHSVPKQRSLFAYELPRAEAAAEERFLRERLWLSPTSNIE